MRFDREKVKSEEFKDKFIKTQIELQKARDILTKANKAMKQKDLSAAQKDM